MGRVTYKPLYSLISEEIARRLSYRDTERYRNQLGRDVILPNLQSSASALSATEIVRAIQDLLAEALPAFIIEGLEVVATDPASNNVIVTAGKGSKGGALYELEEDTTVYVPFNGTDTVFYVSLYLDRIMIDKNVNERALPLAKITIPAPGETWRVFNNKDDRDDEQDAYITGYKEYKLYGDPYGHFEEDTIEMLRDNIGDVLADNLIGNIRLSEDLKITNTQGSLQIDSSSIKLFNTAGTTLAKFNRNGTFYYDENGAELARFASDSARIGNILITPNSIQSENFVSGALGSGFQIKDDGDAEFNNIRARGKLTASVFEKDTISVIGGNLLVLDGDVLEEDMTSADSSTLTVSGDTVFSVGDILRIKDGVDDEWMEVVSRSENTYVVTRDKASQYASNDNPAWTAGVSVVNFGQSGDGGIFLTSSESGSPYMSMFTHAGAPWTTLTTRARFGNLNGYLGYLSDIYGVGIGDSNAYLKYDPIYGLRIKGEILVTGGNVPVTFYQAAEPMSGMKEGDYWVDTDDSNRLYIFQGGSWVEVAGASGTEGIQTFYQSATASGEGVPTSLHVGDLWVNTDDGKLYRAASIGADQIVAGEWELTNDVINPAEPGLYMSSSYMGYYDGVAWKVYISNGGNFLLCGNASNYMCWNGALLCVRGSINADDIDTGRLCADIIGAGCIFLCDGITIANIQGSGLQERTEFDALSIRSYNVDGRKTFEICDGHLFAEDLKLQDPACNCNYTYLSAGGLRFHDVLGDVPYVKRICSGCANTGTYVVLNGWTTQPEVMVSIKSLYSYSSAYSAQCQQWNVYYDNLQCYTTSPTCFGYCFQLHSMLQLAAAQGSECVKNAAFGACYLATGSNVCSSIQRMSFQFWSHPAAPTCWCYGCFCFSLCYRCYGCGVWQGSCTYTYTQPHASVGEMTSTYTCSYTLNLPSAQCWEFMAVCTGLTWFNSGICFQTITCYLCSRALGAASAGICGQVFYNYLAGCPTGCITVTCLNAANITVAGSTPSNVFCAYACFCWCTYAPHLCQDINKTCFFGGEPVCCHYGCTCAKTAVVSPYSIMQYCYTSLRSSATWDFCSSPEHCNLLTSWGVTSYCVDLNTYKSCAFPNLCICNCIFALYCINTDTFQGCICSYSCAYSCFVAGTLYQCYCVITGDAASCCYCLVYSICDTYATQQILDSAGVLNWLAIAYT